MSENMLRSTNKAEKFDLSEFRTAKVISEEFPQLIYLFQKMIDTLEPRKYYTSVHHVQMALIESVSLMNVQLEHYQDVLKKKGRVE